MESYIFKHLEFVQAIITRMNTNSFQIKGWCITIITALFAVYASTNSSLFILITLMPISLFYILDSYYLMLERKFRGLYDDIVNNFNTEVEIKPFDLTIKKYEKGEYSFQSSLYKNFPLYFILATVIVIVYCYIFSKTN